jgi:hypothetical protein
MSRNQWLLGILSALLAVKFVLQPWLESQSEEAAALAVLTQRLDRSIGVIENREAIGKSASSMQVSLARVRQRFPDAADLQSYRIEVQEKVGATAAQAGLGIKSFEWLADGRATDAGLVFSRARFQIDGGLRRLVELQTGLEGQWPNMFVRELNLSGPTVFAAPDESAASLTLVADFYFRPAKPGGGQ